jgi:GTP cyclohydrolase II
MSDINTERSGGILRVELNRPAKKNAMTAAMYTGLAEIFGDAGKDEAVRVVLWHSAGDAFSAGNDMGDFLNNPPGPGNFPQGPLMDALIGFEKPIVVAVQGVAIAGEVLGSLRCDCRDQLEMAMQAIAKEARGLVIYEYQEGRGIGLMAKLEAYELQDAGFDTVEANHALGFKADLRDFSLPAAIVLDLGIKKVRLLSNNPRKARALTEKGIEVVGQFAPVKPCQIRTPAPTCRSRRRKQRMLSCSMGASGRDRRALTGL